MILVRHRRRGSTGPINAAIAAAPTSATAAYRSITAATSNTPVHAAAHTPRHSRRPRTRRPGSMMFTMPARIATSSARNSGSLNTDRCTLRSAGVASATTPVITPAPVPAAADTSSTMPAHVQNAASTMSSRAPCTGDSPALTGTEIAVENPGGKCESGSDESDAAQLLVGTRYTSYRTSDCAAPRYDMASGSSPGPGDAVASATITHASAPTRNAAPSRLPVTR